MSDWLGPCDSCPLRCVGNNTVKVDVYGDIERADVVFVGDHPKSEEDVRGVSLAGEVGRFFRQVLKDVEIENYAYVDAVRCRPPGEKLVGPASKAAASCKPFLEEAISSAKNAKLIVPMGNLALQSVTGEKGIRSYRGKVQYKGKVCVFPTFHPAYILNSQNKDEECAFEQDMLNISRLVKGEYEKKVLPAYRYAECPSQLLEYAKDADFISFDIETNCLSPWGGPVKGDKGRLPRILTIAFCKDPEAGALVVPWESEFFSAISDVLSNNAHKIAHNYKFEYSWLVLKEGYQINNFFMDTMLFHYLLDENSKHSLSALTWVYTDLGGYDEPLEAWVSSNPECDPSAGGSYANIPATILLPYAGGDVDATFRIASALAEEADQELWDVHNHLLVPAAMHLARVEKNGFHLDRETNKSLGEELLGRVDILESGILEMPEVQLFCSQENKIRPNFRSPAQVRTLFEKYFGIPPVKVREGTGNASWDKESVGVLAQKEKYANHRFIQNLAKIRSILQIHSNTVKDIVPLADTQLDGMLRCNFLLHVVVTGRLAARNPNMQAIPRDNTADLLGIPSVKTQYTSRWQNGVIVQADYSQIELRIIAMLSGDANFRQLFEGGGDPHAGMGKTLYKYLMKKDLPSKEEDAMLFKKWRSIGKTQNFGIVYGQTPAGMSEKTGLSVEVCKRLTEATRAEYPDMVAMLDGYHESVRKNGWVSSPVGRKRHIVVPDRASKALVNALYREAGNSPIQSAASDLTLSSSIRIESELANNGLQAKIFNIVHDSIVVDAPSEELLPVISIMKQEMTCPQKSELFRWVDPTFPLVVDFEYGPNWGDMKDVDVDGVLIGEVKA